VFTDRAQEVIDLAKDYAFSSGSQELSLSAILTSVGKHPEAGVLLAECLGWPPDRLRGACPDLPAPAACPGKLPLADPVRDMLKSAKDLTVVVPDRFHPGLIDIRHLACALAMSRPACTILNAGFIGQDAAVLILTGWYGQESRAQLQELTERLRAMRSELLSKVFGQDHAVHAFVEGLFNAELVAAADTTRKAPRGLFVFAGPPGVGKTYLAELGASYLNRPFKRFDMTAFSGHQQHEALTGQQRAYRGAGPGVLTSFVEKNPNAVLLFDEIEKAHLNVIQLFLQILDAGTLEDKYEERLVLFRDTVIIFTTNAGRKLYDHPNESGVHAANATFHRKTVLDALASERPPGQEHAGYDDAGIGEPIFPAAICSRMATGYPVLFNHLGVNELDRVARTELTHVARLMERQYYKETSFHDLISLALVLREGANTDARTLRSQAEAFVKGEIFKFCQLFKTDRLDEVFEGIDTVVFDLDQDPMDMEPDVMALFVPPEKPHILLVADHDIANLYLTYIAEARWSTATAADDALQILADEDVDMVLLDIWLGRGAAGAAAPGVFDHTPAASSQLDKGQETLRKIRQRAPHVPVFLLSFTQSPGDDEGTVDSELFLACVRGGGARGLLNTAFTDLQSPDARDNRDRFAESLVETCKRLYREKAIARMGSERKTLAFDTIPDIDQQNRRLAIRLRNFYLTRAISAQDSGEMVDDVERPRTRFDEVFGADSAKSELKFFIDYLKNPRRYLALGLEPPKGVLLYGPPGTGKTMLARAMAGESDVAFISKSAGSFVTIWQGSGGQAVRSLFARARRYAPSIVFIDEIDAIGKVRTGSQGEEQALNSLLTEMDGFTSESPDRPVFVLAATNFHVKAPDPDQAERYSRMLDPALVRRFSRKIKVELPERSAREGFLAKRLRGRRACSVSDTAIRSIGHRSINMSIADLNRVVEAASREAVKSGKVLDDQILNDAFETLDIGDVKKWDPSTIERVARHEAGHTLMYWHSGWWAVWVTIVAREQFGGYMHQSADEFERQLKTKADLLASIRTSLGGRAAEMVYYGTEGGLSNGAGGDLAKATSIAEKMRCKFGMCGRLTVTPSMEELSKSGFGAVSSNDDPPASGDTSPAVDTLESTDDILQAQLKQTLIVLEDNRQYLDALASELVNKERLTEDDLKRILPPIGSGVAP
jgi:cell division protease FtsH